MKILITGHQGLIGAALYKRLSEVHDVVGYDKGDGLYFEKYDLIVHAAANCVIRDTISNPALAKKNIDLTHQIFELARKYNSKLVLFSSGRVSHNVFNPYTVSKRYLEFMAFAYKECYDLDFLVIRPETVWGRSLNNNRAVIKWIAAAEAGEPLVIYGPESKELPPVYIDDFTDMALHLINNFKTYQHGVYNVSGQIRKAHDIARAIVKQTNSKSKIIFEVGELTQPQECLKADFTSEVKFEDSLERYLNV